MKATKKKKNQTRKPKNLKSRFSVFKYVNLVKILIG